MKIVFDKNQDHYGWVCEVDVFPSEVQSVEYATSNVDSVIIKGSGHDSKKRKQYV